MMKKKLQLIIPICIVLVIAGIWFFKNAAQRILVSRQKPWTSKR